MPFNCIARLIISENFITLLSLYDSLAMSIKSYMFKGMPFSSFTYPASAIATTVGGYSICRDIKGNLSVIDLPKPNRPGASVAPLGGAAAAAGKGAGPEGGVGWP
jgi:hypothetical protein